MSHCGFAIYIKKYLKAKEEELWKLNYFTMQKYNLQKNSLSKRNQNPSRCIDMLQQIYTIWKKIAILESVFFHVNMQKITPFFHASQQQSCSDNLQISGNLSTFSLLILPNEPAGLGKNCT